MSMHLKGLSADPGTSLGLESWLLAIVKHPVKSPLSAVDKSFYIKG